MDIGEGSLVWYQNQEIDRLRQQLEFEKREHIEMQKYILELERTLAECQKERDEYKVKAVIADMPMSEVEDSLKKQLVTAEALLAKYREALEEVAKYPCEVDEVEIKKLLEQGK